MKVLRESDGAIAEAAIALANDEVVAFPAETMYGLGVNPLSTKAIERLFEAKGRPETNPIPVIVADEDQMFALVRSITPEARKLIDRFWPGPLSLVLPKSPIVPDILIAGRDDICIRCPGSPIARALCAAYGRAITSTSANRSGEPPIQTFASLDLDGIAVAIDAGELEPGPASTIYDVSAGKILREGPIGHSAIFACLQD